MFIFTILSRKHNTQNNKKKNVHLVKGKLATNSNSYTTSLKQLCDLLMLNLLNGLHLIVIGPVKNESYKD